MKVIECVPNFSEGRDRAALEKIQACFCGEEVLLLDFSADADHNRSVATVAGEPSAVARAVIDAAGVAAANIDLRSQRGEHPRIGATDVVPFVPIRGVGFSEAVDLARDTAQGIAVAYDIPTYLYGLAAARPQCVNLADIRRGGFEGLREKMRTVDFLSDFGGMRPHPTAGATVVGVRKFLIAFNVNLTTDDVTVAREIAHRIRERDGGLPAVKALGVYLSSSKCAQVTMNLTDYEITSPIVAFRAVRDCALSLGAQVKESELVGLAPRAAFEGVAAEDIMLPHPIADKILENRFPAAWLRD